MNDIERKARALLAYECPECGGDNGHETEDGWLRCSRCSNPHDVTRHQAMQAIIAALTPPEGYEQALQDAARYWYIRDIAAGEPSAFAQIEDAAFAAHYGNAAQFDINIDDQMAARPEVSP